MKDSRPTNLSDSLTKRFVELPEVRLAFLFGSQARGNPRADSDFDFAVLVDDALVSDASGINRTVRRLAGQLGKEVPSHLLDIVLLNAAPALLRHRVLRDGMLLFARSEEERVRFALRTNREYQDMEPRLSEHRKRRIARLKGGADYGRSGDILKAARRAGRLLAQGAKSR